MIEKRQPAPEKSTKAAYGTPQLHVYGNLRELTHTVAATSLINDSATSHTATH
jgi:hypothetical protein